MSDKITVSPLFPDENNTAAQPAASDGIVLPASVTTDGTIPTEEDISQLGTGSRRTYDAITAKLLESHRASDLGAMGAKLNELVSVAKGLDYQKGRKSLVESALGFLRNERERIIAHVQSVQSRLDALKAQVEIMVAAERDHIKTLGELQTANRTYHDEMLAAAAKGEAWLASVNAKIAEPLDTADAFAAPKHAALQQLGARLERAINDFKNATTLAKHEALTIQMEVNNAQVLLDEFDRAETLVLPALRSIVGQQLIQIDQKRGAETDAMLRATLDDALRTQAQLTGENTVELAKLQRTSAIKTTTLLECETILDQATVKVKAIQEAARQARLDDAANRTEVERRLLGRVAN